MLSFAMSREQKMVRDAFAEVTKNLVTPSALEMDESGQIPAATLQKIWELGASTSMIPEAYGGDGMAYSSVLNCIVLEELSYGDPAVAVAATLPSLFMNPVAEMGTQQQKKRYLPGYCGPLYPHCTLALQEPHFGSDPARLMTAAVKRGSSYVLNGKKCFVPQAGQASHMLVAAAVEGRGALFIVSGDNPGLHVGARERNLGLRALDTCGVTLQDCEVPEEDRLGGAEGCDFNRALQKTRVGMAALGAGIVRGAFDFAKKYASERVQFGEPIAHRQAVAFMIAEMAYESECVRLLAWKAASRLEAGKDAARESYLAKLYAGEMTMKIADYGVQILGGHGYIRDYPLQKHYRDGRGIGILEAMATV